MAKRHLPGLAISLQNLNYYASLANFYTIYDLRRMRPEEQTYLYLLCYAWLRYRQLTDNLIDAVDHHMKQFENEIKVKSNKLYILEHTRRQQETQQVGRLLLIYVDDGITDATPFGAIRQRAFAIIPRDTLQLIGQRLARNHLVNRQCSGKLLMGGGQESSPTPTPDLYDA